MSDPAISNAETEAVPAIDAEPQPPVLTQESSAVVPVSVPSGERGEKVSFWRRIAPARSARRAEAGEALTAQLEELASQLAATELALSTRIEAVERRIDEVWEVEEQLSHLIELQKRLEAVEVGQKALAASVRTTNRLVVLLTGVAVTAAALTAAVVTGALVL